MKTCIATTTFSTAFDLRAHMALEMVKRAVALGINVVVVDGGSHHELRSSLFDHGALLTDEKDCGMGPSRRQAINEAWNIVGPTGSVFWMEPEKWPLVDQIFLMKTAMEKTGADIVVPARKSMESYPPIQQAAERLGNMYFAKVTGHWLDVWVGPRLIGPRAIRHFLDYNDDYGGKWDSIFIPIIRAIAAGLKVAGCDVNYVHPAEQTAAEEADPNMDLKRLKQLDNLVPSFYMEARKLGLLK